MKDAWAWAKTNKKHFTSDVHGEEYISVDVENFRKRSDEESFRMEMQTGFGYEEMLFSCGHVRL